MFRFVFDYSVYEDDPYFNNRYVWREGSEAASLYHYKDASTLVIGSDASGIGALALECARRLLEGEPRAVGRFGANGTTRKEVATRNDGPEGVSYEVVQYRFSDSSQLILMSAPHGRPTIARMQRELVVTFIDSSIRQTLQSPSVSRHGTPSSTRGDSLLVDVVGIGYEDRSETVAQLRVNEQVWLHREPFNPYDPNAIHVRRENGQSIGYIGRNLARQLAPRFDVYGAPIPAIVAEFTPGHPPYYPRGVRIRFTVPG